METLEARQGADVAYRIQLRGEDGLPLAGVYAGTEPLSVRVWAGGEQAALPLASTAASWADATDGTITLAIGRADTAAIDPGLYWLLVRIADGADTVDAYEARLLVEPEPGTDGPLPSYCTMDDVRVLAPWIDQLVSDSPLLHADLGAQRRQAREDIDDLVLRRARTILDDQRLRHAPIAWVAPLVPADGVDAGPGWGPSIYPDTSLQAQLEAIRAHLAADRLVRDGRLVQAAAQLTIACVCAPQLGDGPGETPFQVIARRFEAAARGQLRGWIARIDPTGTGTPIWEIL